MCIHSTSLLVL